MNKDKFNPNGKPGQFEPFRLYRFAPLYFKGGGSPDIKDTADQKELAKIASERWIEYQRDFVPAENHYIDEMLNYDNQARTNAVEGAAASGVEQAYSDAQGQQRTDMAAAGFDPSSGAFKEAINTGANDKAVARADNVTRTGQALQDQKVQGMKNVVAIGNGQAAETLSGMNTIAANSAQDAIDSAQNSRNETSSTYGAVGTAVGMGTRAALGSSDDSEDK